MVVIIENTTVELLYASLFVFWIVYLYFVKDYGYWEVRDVPHVPAVFPFGSLSETVLGRCYLGTTLDKIYKEYKGERYVGFTEVRRPGLLIRDPELIRMILRKDFHHFTDHPWVDVHPNDYMFNNLFNLKGQEWKRMRHKLTPAYTAAKMKMMFFLVKKCSDMLHEAIEALTKKNNVVDIKNILSRFNIDVIGTCVFGLEVNSLKEKDAEFYKIAQKITTVDFSVLAKMYILNAFPIFSKYHCFDFLDSDITNFITEVIQSTINYREQFNISRLDFLDLMIKLRRNQSILEDGEKPEDLEDISKPEKREGLTMKEVRAETFLFFTAGFETSSCATLFSLYELACNWHIQDLLFSEVTEVLSRHGDTISYQALQEMTYMDQVINESMRLYPIFPHLFRVCTENYRIPSSNLVIEKGLRILIPVYSLHHDPEYFDDPYTFNPERFNPKNEKERHPCVFLPFGEGPRMCIGFRFGMMLVKTALVTIISQYVVSLAPDTQVPLGLKGKSYTTQPSKPLMLEFSRRQQKI